MVSAQEILFTLAGVDELSPAINTAKESFAGLRQAATEAGVGATGVFSDTGNAATEAGGVVTDQMGQIREQLGYATDSTKSLSDGFTQGLTPAMMGMPTDKFDELTSKTSGASSAIDKTSESFKGLNLAGGLALTMLGGMMESFAQSCINAATAVQGSMSAMGGALGMSATQAIQSTPQLEQMALGWSAQTGIDPTELAKGATAASLYPGMAGNPQLLEQSMPLIGGLGTVMGTDPSSAAAMYGKVLTAAAPSTMMTAKMGLTTDSLNASAQSLGLGSSYASLDPTDRVKALNDALTKNGTISQVNAAYADSSAGKMAIFNAKLQDLEAQLGTDLIPTLTWLMDNVLSPLAGAMEKFPVLGNIIAGLLLVGGALGLMAGPLMALSAFPGALTEIKDGANWAYESLIKLGGGETAAGDAAVVESGEEDDLAISEGYAGTAAVGGGVAIAGIAAAAWAVYDLYKSIGVGTRVSKEDGGSTGAGVVGAINNFAANLPMNWLIGEISGKKGPSDKDDINQWHQLQGAGGAVSGFFGNNYNQAQQSGGNATSGIQGLGGNIWKAFENNNKTAVQSQKQTDAQIKNGIGASLKNIEDQIKNNKIKAAWDGLGAYMVGAWKNTVSGVESAWSGLSGAVTKELNSLGQAIMSAGGTLYNDAMNLGHQIYSGVMNGLGIHSPGFIQQSIISELEGVNGALGKYGNTLGNSAKNMGGSMVSGFGSNSLGTRGATHIHQHNEKITIDASHMDENQLKSVLTKMFESMNKNVIPNIQVS